MFARGNWSIFGLTPDSIEKFKSSLNDQNLMLSLSQLAADSITCVHSTDSYGINPYDRPRLDEGEDEDPFALQHAQDLADWVLLGSEERANTPAPENALLSAAYGAGLSAFAFDEQESMFGFWFVVNTWKDVSHIATIKEAYSYRFYSRPVKFLSGEDKKQLTLDCTPKTAAIRKQFPVIVDLTKSLIYVESTNKQELNSVLTVLNALGMTMISMAWQFNVSGHWTSKALTKVYTDTAHADSYKKRAEDAARFVDEEIEEFEDKEIEKIVKASFATADLGGDQWVSLNSPANIALHPTGNPIVVQSVTNATSLLDATDTAFVYASHITLQERLTKFDKKAGIETSFRVDVLTFELSDAINNTEVGAATLRGFDLPGFKKHIQSEIKKTKQVPEIKTFWRDWTIGMKGAIYRIETLLRHLLDVEGQPGTGLLPYEPEKNDQVIEGDAEETSSPSKRSPQDSIDRLRKMVQSGELTITHTTAIGEVEVEG